MGKNLVSKPMHEWSLCFHLSFALLLVYELQVKTNGEKKKNAYKRSQRHLPNVSVSEWKTCCDLESGCCVKGWVSLVYSVMCLPVGLWRLLRLWPERRQSSSAWLAHVANGRSSVSSGSIVRPPPPHSRVSLYDIYQPPFCLSISQRQLSSCWSDAGVSLSFDCPKWFLNHWETLWKICNPIGMV